MGQNLANNWLYATAALNKTSCNYPKLPADYLSFLTPGITTSRLLYIF